MAASTGSLERIGTFVSRTNSSRNLLVLPLILFEVFFFIVPMFILLRMSLQEESSSQAYTQGFTLDSYISLLTSEFIHGIVVYTFKTAIIITIVTVLLATLYAHAVWRSQGIRKNILLFAVVISLLTTLVVKLYAWMFVLSPNGVINTVMVGTGVVSEPILLLNNEFGVAVGIVYTAFPYAVLSIYSVLETINEDTFMAALDLGASRPRAFVEVILPSALPGVTVASVISFTWGVGTYAPPMILGSSKERSFAIEVADLILTDYNWPAGAALSVLMLIVVLISVTFLFYFLNRYEGGTENGAY